QNAVTTVQYLVTHRERQDDATGGGSTGGTNAVAMNEEPGTTEHLVVRVRHKTQHMLACRRMTDEMIGNGVGAARQGASVLARFSARIVFPGATSRVATRTHKLVVVVGLSARLVINPGHVQNSFWSIRIVFQAAARRLRLTEYCSVAGCSSASKLTGSREGWITSSALMEKRRAPVERWSSLSVTCT